MPHRENKLVLEPSNQFALCAVGGFLFVLFASAPSAAVDFKGDIQPLLAGRCLSCHGLDAQEGGLRLDIRRLALAGGDTATAIVPRASDKSAMIARITSNDPQNRMPLDDEPLSPEEIQLLRNWIDAGAIWPDEVAGHEAAPDHWSFQPIVSAKPPVVESSWGRTPVDAFVLSRLRQDGLEPSVEADGRTLIRRLSLDLLGMPPSLEEVEEFTADRSVDAYERLVDRLLASPRFGERWGKHWLDLARFAESDGYENDGHRPHMWRYRDWVIDAINNDMPFDRFTIAQIAGDLLEDATSQDRVATAFHRNTLHNSAGGADAEEFRSRAVKDRTAVTAAIWMGLTWNCAECHTHKYDPIAQREYYGLYAFFNNADHDSEADVPTIKKADRITQVHVRGNFLDLGASVEPVVPAFLPELKPRSSNADRLDLARWLVSPQHPLTSRVAVNHVWQHLFGNGLVPTPDNFGRKGESPTHPALLDWLAAEFASLSNSEQPFVKPWSRKSLIRLIVCSAVYRQIAVRPEHPPAIDPENRLLWRQNRFRIEAETIRDVALTASGLLNGNVGGPSIQPPLPKGLTQLSELKNERFQEASGSPYRRGLYVHMQRTFPYPLFATFDGPDGNTCTMQRDRSTTPLQALTLLNDPAIDDCAQALGKRLTIATNDPRQRMNLGFELCLSRPPDERERAIVTELIDQATRSGASDEAMWYGVARMLLNLDETITRE